MPKSVPLSVRISDDDAAFLAKFQAPGAATPSEKLRAILAAARQQDEGARDFDGGVAVFENILAPSVRQVRRVQRDAGVRSDLVLKLYERLPELMAELVADAPRDGQDQEALKAFESALADLIFPLIEEILDMGLTARSRTYDPHLIKDRLQPILEIVKLIQLSEKQTQGEVP